MVDLSYKARLPPPPGRSASLILTVWVVAGSPESGLICAQHENMMVLSWQSAVPPPPSSQFIGATSVIGSFSSVYQFGKRSGPPPPDPDCPASGSQVVTAPDASATDAFISRADPLCVSA